MKGKLKGMPQIAKALGVSMKYAYMLSSLDSAFPPAVERNGPAKFYLPADVARYVRTRKSRLRWKNAMDFG